MGLAQIESGTSGSVRDSLKFSALSKIKIPLPPLATQQRIAAILDAADALRRKDQELLRKYDELAQAIFIDMFGDPVKNEKGWEVKKFMDLGKLDRGVSKHRPRNAPELLGGDYPLIQTGDVANSGGIIKTFKATYSDLGLKQSKLWSKGTLCITIAANIAKTGLLDFDACFPDSIVGFQPNNKLSNSVYIQFWIGFLQKILEDNAPESAQKNINLEILRGLDVICPPIELQNEFELKIQLLNCLKEKSPQPIDEILFDSLLHQAFNGELKA
jgi:type I restriction enzyme S subunit